MDNASFLTWAAVCAAGFGALVFAMRSSPLFWPANGPAGRLRHWHAKRTDRLAHGSDRYFEELRTIDTHIAAIAKWQALPPLVGWRRVTQNALIVFLLYLVGLMIAEWIMPWSLNMIAPAWSRDVSPFLVLLTSIAILLQPYPFGDRWQKLLRIICAINAAISLFQLARTSLHYL